MTGSGRQTRPPITTGSLCSKRPDPAPGRSERTIGTWSLCVARSGRSQRPGPASLTTGFRSF
jgi:hypothetical protein